MWVLIVLGAVTSVVLQSHRTLTGATLADGILGVTLGLYICSHPAANLIDLLFYREAAGRAFPSRLSAILWVAMNILTLFAGWLSIFVGTTRLIASGE